MWAWINKEIKRSMTNQLECGNEKFVGEKNRIKQDERIARTVWHILNFQLLPEFGAKLLQWFHYLVYSEKDTIVLHQTLNM